MLRGLIYSVQEGLLALWRTRLVSLLSIGTIAVSFTILGIFVLVSVNVGALTESYGDELVVHLFLKDGLSQSDLAGLRRRLEGDRRVASLGYVGKEEAARRFRRLFPSEEYLLEGLTENPLPESIELTLMERLRTDAAEVGGLLRELGRLEGVEAVRYDRQWVETFEAAAQWIGYAGFAVGGLLILAAIVTTANIIKINIYARRDEIEIMRLVGADGIYVRGPFVIGGLVQGLLASVISLIVLFLLFSLGESYLKLMKIGVLEGLSFRFLPLNYILLFLAGGLLVGFLAGLLSFGRAGRS